MPCYRREHGSYRTAKKVRRSAVVSYLGLLRRLLIKFFRENQSHRRSNESGKCFIMLSTRRHFPRSFSSYTRRRRQTSEQLVNKWWKRKRLNATKARETCPAFGGIGSQSKVTRYQSLSVRAMPDRIPVALSWCPFIFFELWSSWKEIWLGGPIESGVHDCGIVEQTTIAGCSSCRNQYSFEASFIHQSFVFCSS